MLVRTELPGLCIYIEGHKEEKQPDKPGGGFECGPLSIARPRYALCMYCGICVEVCPFDACSGVLL